VSAGVWQAASYAHNCSNQRKMDAWLHGSRPPDCQSAHNDKDLIPGAHPISMSLLLMNESAELLPKKRYGIGMRT
jgi:hypothetical protein